MEKTINYVAETISTQLQALGGYAIQLFGSWSGPVNLPENRQALSDKLSQLGIETIRLYDYADMYVCRDINQEEKEKMKHEALLEAEKDLERTIMLETRKRELRALEASLASCFLNDLLQFIQKLHAETSSTSDISGTEGTEE